MENPAVGRMVEMGFEKGLVKRALKERDWNENAAVEAILMGEIF